MKPRKLLQLTVGRDVKMNRRMLSSGRLDALGDVFRCLVEAIKDQGLLPCLGGSQIMRHRLGSARRRYVLDPTLVSAVQATGVVIVPYRCAGTDDHRGW